MATIGNLIVKLTAQTKPFAKGMKGATRDTKGFSQAGAAAVSIGKKLIGVLGGLGVAFGAQALFGSFTTEVRRLDELAKTVSKLNTSAQGLQELQFAAERTGSNISTLNMALQRMSRRISEAAGGTGEAVKAVKELGLDAKRLATLQTDKQFLEIAEAISQVSTESDQLRLTFKFLDSEGVTLLNLIREGKSGIAGLAGELKRLGGTVSEKELARMEQVADALTDISIAWQRIKANAAVAAVATKDSVDSIVESLRRLGLDPLRFGGRIAAGGGAIGTALAARRDPDARQTPLPFPLRERFPLSGAAARGSLAAVIASVAGPAQGAGRGILEALREGVGDVGRQIERQAVGRRAQEAVEREARFQSRLRGFVGRELPLGGDGAAAGEAFTPAVFARTAEFFDLAVRTMQQRDPQSPAQRAANAAEESLKRDDRLIELTEQAIALLSDDARERLMRPEADQ